MMDSVSATKVCFWGMTPEGATALGERGGVLEPLHGHQVDLSLDV